MSLIFTLQCMVNGYSYFYYGEVYASQLWKVSRAIERINHLPKISLNLWMRGCQRKWGTDINMTTAPAHSSREEKPNMFCETCWKYELPLDSKYKTTLAKSYNFLRLFDSRLQNRSTFIAFASIINNDSCQTIQLFIIKQNRFLFMTNT